MPVGSRTVFYAAAATGGVFKTVNAGTTWEPIFDDMPTLSIGDLAVAESDPNIVWVGTGEANIFRASEAGLGVFKSTDAGKTWKHMGLDGTYTIARVVIHPKNPDIVYVAATGHEWTTNPDRGVYKTTDGGATWQKVLFVNERVGANDLVMDPQAPDTLYAATWNRIRRRWSDPVPGGEDGLFKTTDGGKTWTPINTRPARHELHRPHRHRPLPDEAVDPLRLRRQPHAGRRAEARAKRTPTAGRSSGASSAPRSIAPTTPARAGARSARRAWSASAAPTAGSSARSASTPTRPRRSTSWAWACRSRPTAARPIQNLYSAGLHGDHHGLWIDPNDSSHLINNNDGGVNISYDGGKTWRDFHDGIPAVQFYNVTLDFSTPFWAYGSVQDQGTYRGLIPLRRPTQGAPGRPAQLRHGPAQVGARAGRRRDAHRRRSDRSLDRLFLVVLRPARTLRLQGRGQWTSKEIFPKAAEGEPAYRGQWLAATMLSPHNPQIVYHGFQYLFRSMNKGETWERISPDLTYNNPDQQGKWPYAIPFATITAVDESPFKFGLLYAGTDDGRVWMTKTSGDSWTEITAGLPYNKHVWKVVASKYDQATVYVTLVGRHDDDFNPYIFKSTDYGKTWVSIAANIPGGPVNVVREDPKVKDMLYAGTDTGVYVSRDARRDLERPRLGPADELRLGHRHPPARQRPGHRHEWPGHVDHRRPDPGADRGEIGSA